MKNNILKRILNSNVLINKDTRYKIQLIIVSSVFFVAGTVFTIINFFGTNKEINLGIVTSVFAGLSLLTCVFSFLFKKRTPFVEILFVASALVMFLYFIIWGGAGEHGFSTYWILLLPFLSMMVLGLLKGSIATLTMFLLVAFFLWIPYGRSLLQWKADDTFCLRFPLVYLAAFASSFLFELSRNLTDKRADAVNKRLEEAALHDYLTGLNNRHGLNKIVEEQKAFVGSSDFKIASCMLIDIDNFKSANDTYGHAFGDEVLISLANILKETCGEWAIRFGGDEFICLFKNKNDFELHQIADSIRVKASKVKFESHPDYSYTISIGIASQTVDENYRIERVIELADYQSSRAKKNGKNTIYLLSYDDVLNNKNTRKNRSLFDIFKQ